MVSEERITSAGREKPRSSSKRLGVAHHPPVREEAAAHLLVAEKDFGGDGEVWAEHDFLVKGVDAEVDRLVRRRQRDRRFAPQDFPRRARMNAGQKLDQRRFSRAVLADDGVNLALFERQIDGFEGLRRPKALVELAQRDQRRAIGPGGGLSRSHVRFA